MSRHRRLTRVVAGFAIVLALLVAAVFAFFPLLVGSAPAPLTLPTPGTAAGSGSSTLDGTWTAGTGSMAGYRVRASFLGRGADVVGRTSGATGNVVLADTTVVSATVSVDLTTLQSGGKPQPQLAQIMDTANHQDATWTLTAPIALGSTPVIGKTFTVGATGQLAMNGTSRSVTCTLTARFDGSSLDVVGSIPLLFPDWQIDAPWGLEDHGSLEFLLVLTPST